MLCHHLSPLEDAICAAGFKETYRGSPWSQNCREWVYFDLVLDTESLIRRLQLPPCVVVHENNDPRSGSERGLYCSECHDALVGLLDHAPRFG